MPKPKKIKKKKSFMFTTKHQSENGILSMATAVLSLAVLIASISYAYMNRGEVPKKMGGVGLFALLSNVVGIIAGSVSLREKDIFIWVPRIALILNIVMLLIWSWMVVSGIIFGG